ncbi:MAG: DUF4149 domain-containing protein [Pseudomonadota bacterium]
MLLARARLLVATLWAGSLWTVALVAQMLFASFDRAMAGSVAAPMFRLESYLSLGCAAVLLVLLALDAGMARRRTVLRLVLAMLACAVAMQFVVQPMMAALRESGPMDAALRARFGMLHGVAGVIYLAESVLAAFLLIKNTTDT